MVNKVSLTNFVEKIDRLGGIGNTHPVDTKFFNFCIDYFSMVIDTIWNKSNDKILTLLKLLKIDKIFPSETHPRYGYEHTLCFDEHIFVSYGGKNTSIDDTPTVHVELSGQGCRKFEELGGDWIELLEYGLCNARIKRVDLAYDLFNQFVDYQLLLDKTFGKEFVSICKGYPIVMVSKDKDSFKSFSITFGSRNSNRQLQIYDKKTERESKDYEVSNIESWTRIEARYKNNYAQEILNGILVSLYNKNFDVFVKNMIYSIVDYKDRSFDDSNLSRNETAKFWKKILDVEERVIIKNQFALEKTICKKANWMKRSVSKTLKALYLSNPSKFYDYINFLLVCDIEKLDNQDLDIINNAKNEYFGNLKFENLKELADFLRDNVEDYSVSSEYIENLIRGKINEEV